MPNNDFEFSLDDILAEFKELESGVQPEPERKEKPVSRPQPVEAFEEPAPVKRREPVIPEHEFSRKREKEIAEARMARRSDSELSELRPREYQKPRRAGERPERSEKTRPTAAKAEKPFARREKAPRSEKSAPTERAVSGKVKIISLVASALLFIWGIFNVHPGATVPVKDTPSPVVTMPVVTVAPVETPSEEISSEGGGETAPAEPEVPAEPEKPHYTIPEGSVLAPKANPANFGSVPVGNAAELDAVIQQARDMGLLREDEKMVFDSSLAFNTGSYYQDIKYYLDETILAIAWKQIVDGNTVTCMEVKVADASQFRRKITGDTYGSPADYLSNLNKSTNAVVSMNADYYQFRDYGVMVYDGTLYKCTDKRYLVHNGIDYKWYNCLDNCFITREGDMILTYFGEEFTWDSMQQFVNDNNISFSLSFGPILVDNYEVQDHYVDWYPVGEVDKGYSRAGFGQFDERHYLYMSLNHSDEKSARWTMYEFGQFFQSRGVEKAYAFDGGQTSEIIFNSEIYNHIDKSSERWVSDMVYFGTALPEEVWNNG